jgi:hypothetical protein
MEIWDTSRIPKTVNRRLWKLIPCIVCRCIDVNFFRPKGHSVRNKYFVFLNMASVYHIVTIRVNETSWAHVWRLHFSYLGTVYDSVKGSKHPYLAYPITTWRVLSEEPLPLIYLRNLQPPRSMGQFCNAEHTFFDPATARTRRPG